MIIDTNFNLNILLKLFFSLSKKIIFFSPILTNNNLSLKIYYENIVIAFPSFFSFFFFSLFFSPPDMYHISFFSPFFFPSIFLLHTRTLTLFFSPSFLFFPTTSSKLQNVLESSLSSSFFYFSSFLPFLLALHLKVSFPLSHQNTRT